MEENMQLTNKKFSANVAVKQTLYIYINFFFKVIADLKRQSDLPSPFIKGLCAFFAGVE